MARAGRVGAFETCRLGIHEVHKMMKTGGLCLLMGFDVKGANGNTTVWTKHGCCTITLA
eukprot:JP442038.1.p2 GENE.JP442038.1~~JP442038.1.p2  ORF type:complete len:59 (+),score=0.27 JP442038.1:109-285(+)